jgi:long-subunit fatty acid transport protein
VQGSITSDSNIKNPYFLFAHRYSPTVVFGLDVSQPVVGVVEWPADGFQKALGINSVVRGYEIIPKMSVSLTPSLALGAAFRLSNIYDSELSSNATAAGYTQSLATGWGIGGALGFWYKYNPCTMIDGSVFSSMNANLRGTSTQGSSVTNNFSVGGVQNLPTTFIVSLTRIFNQKFIGSAKVAYSMWGSSHNLILLNRAGASGPIKLPLNWRNTFYVSLFGKYLWTPKTSLLGLVSYDQSLVNSTNNIVAFPIGNKYSAGVGAEYRFVKQAAVRLLAGGAISNNPNITTASSVPAFTASGHFILKSMFADAALIVDF